MHLDRLMMIAANAALLLLMLLVDCLNRRVEITGPVDRKMVINGLNSGARYCSQLIKAALHES
jgi:malate synthase